MAADTFFTELQKLIFSHPSLPLVIINCEDSEFCNEIYSSKNMYYCFDSYESADCCYIFDSYICASCVDCDYAVESELCYECVDVNKCFNCEYLEYCGGLTDSAFSYDCGNCNNIFGCVNLKNKSFCIFNRQLTEEEYKVKVKELKKLPPEKILAVVSGLKKRFPLTQTIGFENENTDYGNYIHFNKNCYLCFDAAYDEDCGYLYDSFHCQTCYDLTYASQGTELTYQALDSTNLFNCNFIIHGSSCQDSSYLFNCFNVKNSLGCVGLKNKDYCILNRQFTKEEYDRLSRQILAKINDANLEWGNLVYQMSGSGKSPFS